MYKKLNKQKTGVSEMSHHQELLFIFILFLSKATALNT